MALKLAFVDGDTLNFNPAIGCSVRELGVPNSIPTLP